MRKLTVEEIKGMEFVKAVPREYSVTIDRVIPGVKVFNPLEMTELASTEDRCYMVTGTVGEQWFINADKVLSKYRHIDGNRYLVSGGSPVFVTKVSEYVSFEAYGDGTIIEINHPDCEVGHGEGDYLVCGVSDDGTPDTSCVWSVNGVVFGGTYKLL